MHGMFVSALGFYIVAAAYVVRGKDQHAGAMVVLAGTMVVIGAWL